MLINLILITLVILIIGGFQTFANYKQSILRKPLMQYYNVTPVKYRGELMLDDPLRLRDCWLYENYSGKASADHLPFSQFILERYRDAIITAILDQIRKQLENDPTMIAIQVQRTDYLLRLYFQSQIAFFPYEKEKTLPVVVTDIIEQYPRPRFF